MADQSSSPAMMAGRALLGGARLASRLVPRRLRQVIEDRIFYGIFNTTRVMNDNYGWRPGDAESSTTTGPAPRRPR